MEPSFGYPCQAPLAEALPALHRSLLRREGPRHGRPLPEPDHALVLCVDEKSQVQALERTQPLLPLGLGYVEGVTHGYLRHGTTTLFAALDVATGRVLAQCRPRHRYHLHFTPTYSSWLNQVEIWFHLITQKAVRRGSFSSVTQLKERIRRFTDHYNPGARPFVWTATADSILHKIQRLCTTISGTEH